MDNKLLNEDIQNIKYLFGYKPGRVISEQDIDYTTEDFSHDEIDEEGKRHPERQVRLSKSNKIVGSYKKGVGFTPTSQGEELGFEFNPTDIPHGTRMSGTEIGDFDYEDDDFNFKMPPYDDEEMEEGYQYDDVDDVNPDDLEDDFSELNLDDLGFNDNEDDDDTLFEQEEPENDRYMFFSNLEQIHRQMGILLEKDPEMIHSILENGHDWAQDHIATAKESIDQVFDFIMNEENGDDEEDFEDEMI